VGERAIDIPAWRTSLDGLQRVKVRYGSAARSAARTEVR
jgi:hypothetical protein